MPTAVHFHSNLSLRFRSVQFAVLISTPAQILIPAQKFETSVSKIKNKGSTK